MITKTWNFNATIYNLDVVSYSWDIEGQTYETQSIQHSFATAGSKDVVLTIESENGNSYTSMTTIDVVDITAQTVTISGKVSQNEVGVADAEVIFSAMTTLFGEAYLETTTDATGYYEFTNTLYTDLIYAEDTTLFSLTTNACDGISAVNTPFDESNMSFEIDLDCDIDYAVIHIAAAPIDELEMEWYFAAYTFAFMTSHTWYINGETISENSTTYTFPSSGSYGITVTAQSSAGNTYTSTRTIEVGSSYASNCFAYFIHDVESSTAGQAYFVNASLGSNLSYLWDFGDGNTSTEPYPIHTFADSDTTYTVCLTITGDNNCEDSYCMIIYDGGDGSGLITNGSKEQHHLAKSAGFDFIVVPVLSANVGMREVETFDLKVYPNPASDVVYLSANGSKMEGGNIYVTDVSGRMVEKIKVSGSGLVSIPVNNFSSGVYFVQYRGEAISKTVKVVVE